MWLHSLKVAQLLRSAACLDTNQPRSYLNHLVISLKYFDVHHKLVLTRVGKKVWCQLPKEKQESRKKKQRLEILLQIKQSIPANRALVRWRYIAHFTVKSVFALIRVGTERDVCYRSDRQADLSATRYCMNKY